METGLTVYFVCWKEEGQGQYGYFSGFGYTDKEEAIAKAKELAAKQQHRNPEYPPTTWIGIRAETVVNEYVSLAEIEESEA